MKKLTLIFSLFLVILFLSLKYCGSLIQEHFADPLLEEQFQNREAVLKVLPDALGRLEAEPFLGWRND